MNVICGKRGRRVKPLQYLSLHQRSAALQIIRITLDPGSGSNLASGVNEQLQGQTGSASEAAPGFYLLDPLAKLTPDLLL